MIDNLEEKLEGKLPITREELLEIVSSWGREFNFTSTDDIYVDNLKVNECYPLENLDISQITDLSDVFCYSPYNGDLSKWNVSNVITMKYTFWDSKFNNDSIKNWDVSNLKIFTHIFGNSIFNGDLSKWNLTNCICFKYAFANSKFNNDSLKDWDVSKVEDMSSMFYNSSFNGNVSKWDISNVSFIDNMFYHSKFDGDISKWKFNQNIYCDGIFNNNNFKNKYNDGKEIPNFKNEFLEWFEDNKLKIASLNITKEDLIDIDDYLSSFNENNLEKN